MLERICVSPGLDDAVVNACRQRKVACLPGVATATEMQHAVNQKIGCVKFFPRSRWGSIAAASTGGPLPPIAFRADGRHRPKNLADNFSLPQTLAVGGSWLVKPGYLEVDQLADADFDQIVVDCERARQIAKA